VFSVYILRCADGSLYVGSTNDVPARLQRHQEGGAPMWTAARCPVDLVFVEDHDDLRSAVARERQLKRWTRVKKEALIAGDVGRLKQL
jgi:predicted GIY-YIG superfamily endonuclease